MVDRYWRDLFGLARLTYLGGSNLGVGFVEWLAGRSEETVLKLARLAVRHLRTALGRDVRELPRTENVRRLMARTLALDLPPAGSTGLRGLLKRAPRFTRVILGPWEAWFAESALRRLPLPQVQGRRAPGPDVQLELGRGSGAGGGVDRADRTVALVIAEEGPCRAFGALDGPAALRWRVEA